MAHNSLAKLPQELIDYIGKYLDPKSIARTRLASKKTKFFLSSEKVTLERYSRVWGSVLRTERWNKDLWKEIAQTYGGNAEDYDMILLGSDLEYIYYADDEQKKPPRDYGPLHLWVRIIKRGGSSYEVPSYILKREFSLPVVRPDTRMILHTSIKGDENTFSDVWNLGITHTCVVFSKLNSNLNRIDVDMGRETGDSKPYCASTFKLDLVPGSNFSGITIRSGMLRGHRGAWEDDEVTKHLKQTITTLHRMDRHSTLVNSK